MIDTELLFRGEHHALAGQLGDRAVDIVDFQAEMVEADIGEGRCAVADRIRKQLDILRIGDAQIDDPETIVLIILNLPLRSKRSDFTRQMNAPHLQ